MAFQNVLTIVGPRGFIPWHYGWLNFNVAIQKNSQALTLQIQNRLKLLAL